MSKQRKDGPSGRAIFWTSVVVGTGLILFPEPATTAAGLLIVGSALGVQGLKAISK